MKIKTQVLISIIFFSVTTVIIAATVAITDNEITHINAQREISSKIERGVSNLNTVSINYFLFQEDLQIDRYQTQIASLYGELSGMILDSSQQVLANRIMRDLQILNESFVDVTKYLQNTPRNVSVRIDRAFQLRWSDMAFGGQILASDASKLSKSLYDEAIQINYINKMLMFMFLVSFGSFLAVILFVVFKRVMISLRELQDGISIISSGNLDYKIKTKRQNEITELSHAFNSMTTNLKNITALKTDLEREAIERKKAEEAIKKSLDEKEVLLKEIHHRVKNNLQMVSSLLNLNAYRTKNQEVLKVLEQSQKRIKSIILAHTILYQSENLSSINSKAYLKSLSDSILGTCDSGISIKLDVEEILINIDSAVPFGLVTNELITNAIKHSFPTNNGIIYISLHKVVDNLELTVSNNGIDMPEGFDWEGGTSLGLKIVKLLTSQLNGKIELVSRKGTKFKVTIPNK